MRLGTPFDVLPVVLPPPPSESELLALRVLTAVEQLQMALRDLTVPAPQVILPEPDLAEIVTAVNGLKPGPTAQEIADAIAATLIIPPPPAEGGMQPALVQALEDIANRLKGIGRQAYGGGSVSLNPGQSVGITGSVNTDPTGTFKYYSAAADTLSPLAGEKVRGIFAACTTVAGSVTVAGGSSIPIAANGTFFDSPENLTGPCDIVFASTVTAFVRVLA